MSIERILAGAGDNRVNMDSLLVLIVGNMLYEAGQVYDIGWGSYIKDTWNFIDFFIYTVFLVWAYIRFSHEESWYYTHTAQQVRANPPSAPLSNGGLLHWQIHQFRHLSRTNHNLTPGTPTGHI
jgi:hypothetical protein